MNEKTKKFWLKKAYTELSESQWESLCDRCGQCCVNKVDYEDAYEIHFTELACKQLNCQTGTCKNYKHRQEFVPDCLKITPENVLSMTCLPHTCAYKLVAHGKDLPEWHPLVSGDPDGAYKAGVSIRNKVVPEDSVKGDLEDFIVEWIPPLDSRTGKVLQPETDPEVGDEITSSGCEGSAL